MQVIKIKFILLIAVFGVLTACGGGGGGSDSPSSSSTTVASTLAFPLLSAYTNTLTSGFTKNLLVSGTCNGTAVLTQSPSVAASFQGTTGFSIVQTTNITLTNCTPSTLNSVSTEYFDSNYQGLGFENASGLFGVYVNAQSMPVFVHVGDTGVLSVRTLYTDNTMATMSGHTDNSYAIEADTVSSAIVNFITRRYDIGNSLQSTSQERYRISASGALTLVSADVQYTNGTSLHIVSQ